jgi:magnesium transporter
MLFFRASAHRGAIPVDLAASQVPADVNWIDAQDPSAAEIDWLGRMLGIHVPTEERLSEIENSSRVSSDEKWLYLSMPAVYRADDGAPCITNFGFVLGRDVLLTIRFAPLKAIVALQDGLDKTASLMPGGLGAFLTVFEAIVDHVADVLEHVGGDLGAVSHDIFSKATAGGHKQRPRHDALALRTVMSRVGRDGDLTGRISESLLGMARILPYVACTQVIEVKPEAHTRLESLRQDVSSLNDYETRLTDKTQFLLDAILGFTNIDQNNVFRVLTVVSIIGIPPTFLASMYGMNFKNIPEYDWAYGYPYVLCMMLASAVLPALWFKWKGWW